MPTEEVAAEQSRQQGEGWSTLAVDNQQYQKPESPDGARPRINVDEAYLRADELRWNRPPGCEEDTLP